MSEEIESDDGRRRQIGGELIIPVCALAFTIYYVTTVIDSPWTAQVNAYMVGAFLTLTVLIFFASRIRMLLSGKATLGFSDLLQPMHVLPKRAAFIALSLGYVVAMEFIGFTLTTALFLWLAMQLLSGGKRRIFTAIIAVFTSLVGYMIFIPLFETRLPKGIIESLLGGLF